MPQEVALVSLISLVSLVSLVTHVTSVTGITSDTATRGDWYRLLGGSGRTPGSRCWVRSAWALYGPSSTSSSRCAQHNPTHYAQDKTTQQIMHNTTHCAPADSILYTVNISTTARKEKKKAKRKTEHQEEDHL